MEAGPARDRRPPLVDPAGGDCETAGPTGRPGQTNVTRAKPATPDFEAALAELEQIVQRLEQGELSLEESLRQFERGVELTRGCQKALRQAEQKIQILSRKGDGDAALQDFTAPDES